MINPNISKMIYVEVKAPEFSTYSKDVFHQVAILRDKNCDPREIWISSKKPIEAGNRRLYLKYSILNDGYYLSDRA